MKSQKISRETLRDFGARKLAHPIFEIGDTIAVSQRIKEGDKERLQVFQGDVIARHNKGVSSTFTVRKIGANSVAVERVYPLYSDIIESIKVVRKGKVRRAKLYYVRDRVGRAARVDEKILTKEQKLAAAEAAQQKAAAAHAEEAARAQEASAPAEDNASE